MRTIIEMDLSAIELKLLALFGASREDMDWHMEAELGLAYYRGDFDSASSRFSSRETHGKEVCHVLVENGDSPN